MKYRAPSRLASIDLNLLLVLRELLRERNVTRAAERMGVTQPAMSSSLSRLRRHFDDELLVRVNREYRLSPLAVQLKQQVEDVCAAAENVFATGAKFNPRSALREFTLLMADYTINVIGERLSQTVAAEAPRASLHIRLVRESLALELPHVVRFVDGLVAPQGSSPTTSRVRAMKLFSDRWVCVVDANNRMLGGTGTPTIEDLARMSWVVPYHRESSSSVAPPISRQLGLLGIRPQVAVRVESYQAIPQFVVGTDRIALVQERLARQFEDQLGLRSLECPGEPEPIVESFWWYEDCDQDPAHVWLRRVLLDLTRDM